ncbi:MAG: hypothetical protein AB7C91_10645 [Sphaerochaeta sp.]|uniref:hypothetical protein n=1 Tax=Sphaerochaeta sp. TaxID=1972642 RepID=UPI002FCCA56D
MRSDIINEVLSVEDRAQKIIHDAERAAREVVSDAQAQANELVRSALRKERERGHAVLVQAESDAAKQLSEFEASLDVSSNLQENDLDRIAQTIVERVCKTEFDALLEAQ